MPTERIEVAIRLLLDFTAVEGDGNASVNLGLTGPTAT